MFCVDRKTTKTLQCHIFCVDRTTKKHFTVSLIRSRIIICEYIIICDNISLCWEPHTQDAWVFSCNLPLARLAEWPGSFTCYCWGRTDTEIRDSTEHWPRRRKLSRRSWRDSNSTPFDEQSVALPLSYPRSPVSRATISKIDDTLTSDAVTCCFVCLHQESLQSDWLTFDI